MVPKARLELAHPRGYLGLSQARLPFHHSGKSAFCGPYPSARQHHLFVLFYLLLFYLNKGYTIQEPKYEGSSRVSYDGVLGVSSG